MDFWVNPSNGSWYNIFNTDTNGITQTYGSRIKIDSSSDAYYIADGGNNAWKYLSLQTNGSTNWDIATKNDNLSGALQFRPAGSGTHAAYMDTSGNWTIQGDLNLGDTAGTTIFTLTNLQQEQMELYLKIMAVINVKFYKTQ